jgi:hypothetical protein
MFKKICFKKTLCLSDAYIRGLITSSFFLITFFCLLTSSYAATIIVNTGVDSATDGLCSFREAIHAANTNARVDGCSAGNGSDLINFSPDISYITITNDGPIEIRSTITISGHTNSGRSSVHVSIDRPGYHSFRVLSPAFVYIDRVSFSRGFDSTLEATFFLVESGATLSLIRTVMTNSRCDTADCSGAIYNKGTLNVHYSMFYGNYNNRGTIANHVNAVANISYSSFMNNNSQRGGALWNQGKMTVNNCTMGENIARSIGGAISSDVASSNLSLNNVTIAFNISQKLTDTEPGGGIYTVGSATIANSIIYNNYRQPQNVTNKTPTDCSGAFTSQGNNILGSTCANSAHSSDTTTVDPGLNINLKEDLYAGLSTSYILPLGSKAINPATSSSTACIKDDQRGIARSTCDIGAVEYAASPKWETDKVYYYATSPYNKVQVTSNSSASGSYYTKMSSNQINDYIEYYVSVPKPGNYRVKVRARKANSNGNFKLELWDNVGFYYDLGTKDSYASTASFVTYDYGIKNFGGENIVFVFTVTGKNSSSSNYNLELDNIELVAQ